MKGGLIVLGLIVLGLGACGPSLSPEGRAEKRAAGAEARGEKNAQQIIAAGGTHTCALADGTVSCWGSNYFGELGNTTNNGTETANPTPTPVAGLG